MQISQRSPQRRAAQAQAAAEPQGTGAGGRRQSLSRRRTAQPSRQTLSRQKISLPGPAATGSDRKKATETPSPQTCWLPQLYLYSRSLLVTPGAVHRADRGRGAPSPARLRTYGGRKGPGGGAAGDRREPHPFPTCPRRPGEKQRPPSPLARGAGSGRRGIGLVTGARPARTWLWVNDRLTEAARGQNCPLFCLSFSFHVFIFHCLCMY